MSKVVEPDASHASSSAQRLERSVDVPGLQRRPVLRREHQTKCVAPCDLCVAQLIKPMPPQDRHELLRQRYGGGRQFGLHITQGEICANARKRLRDNYPSVDQVHIDPPKPERLPTPQTDGQRDRPQRIEPVVSCHFEKRASFIRRPRRHLANRAGRHLDLSGNISSQQFLLDGVLQCRTHKSEQITQRTGARDLPAALGRLFRAAPSLALRRPLGVFSLCTALTGCSQSVQPCTNVLRLQRTQLPFAQSRYDIQTHQELI